MADTNILMNTHAFMFHLSASKLLMQLTVTVLQFLHDSRGY